MVSDSREDNGCSDRACRLVDRVYPWNVIAHFDTINLEQQAQDRVRVSGVRGSSPPTNHKVCINIEGTHYQTIEILLTGRDIEKKADIFFIYEWVKTPQGVLT